MINFLTLNFFFSKEKKNTMFLFSFLSLKLGKNLDIDFPCVAPIDNANIFLKSKPLSNMKLLQVIALTRHGARSPISSYTPNITEDWYCDDEFYGPQNEIPWSPRFFAEGGKIHRRNHLKYDSDLLTYKPSCLPGHLITQGMKEHHDLGDYFRRYYIEHLGFLPKNYDPKYIYLRSSEADRCQNSAISFLTGLYPSVTPDDVISYATGIPSLELLHPQTSQCEDLTNEWNEWVKTDEYKKRKEAAIPYLKPLADSVGVDIYEEEATWMFIGDWMATIACTNHTFPDYVNDTVLEVGMDAVEYYSHGFFNFSKKGVAASAIMREILRLIDSRISGKTDYKFALLSAHDVSIVASLILLGYDNPHWSPFRSYFVTELWEGDDQQMYIRFLYNSEELPIDFMDNQVLVKLSRFRSRVAQYIKYCPEFP